MKTVFSMDTTASRLQRQPTLWAMRLVLPTSFPGFILSISTFRHHNFERSKEASVIYLNLLCASISKTCSKVIVSLFYAISAYKSFHRNVLLSDSRGKMYNIEFLLSFANYFIWIDRYKIEKTIVGSLELEKWESEFYSFFIKII